MCAARHAVDELGDLNLAIFIVTIGLRVIVQTQVDGQPCGDYIHRIDFVFA